MQAEGSTPLASRLLTLAQICFAWARSFVRPLPTASKQRNISVSSQDRQLLLRNN